MNHDLNGILLLDKPINITSNDALQMVKRLLRAKKVGHTGSLDPIATGMLPLCFGEATKFAQFLLESDKHYLVTGKLGETTASGDTETPILEKKEVININFNDIDTILSNFRGNILQIPPMYSAIKYRGQPLYKLVRQGIEIDRIPRSVNFYKLQLIEFENNLMTIVIHCSKGAYVRSLIVDIGNACGYGAHVVKLRRLAVGHFKENQLISLSELKEYIKNNDMLGIENLLLPIESMVIGMPELFLNKSMAYYAFLGHPILISNTPSSGWVKLKSKDGKFLGVGEVTSDGKVIPRKMCRSNLEK